MSADGRSKKSKGRVVPSKYKQSAEHYSSSGTSSDTTKSQYRGNISKASSTQLTGSWNKTEANITLCGKATSTPDQARALLPSFNASVISNASNYVGPIRKDQRIQSALNKTVAKKATVKKKTTSKLPTCGPIGGKEIRIELNQITETQRAELDIYYGQYQLSLFMANKLKRSLQSRSKQAMEKIYEVFCYIRELLAKYVSYQKGICLASILMKIDEHLRKQENFILPTLEVIPTLEKQYEEIALTVDSIRHKLPVKDVILPEPGSEGEIIQTLENITNLLDQVLNSVNNIEEVNASSVAANSFTSQGKLVVEEIKRGSELLLEARDLLLSETSLKLASLTLDNQVP